MRRPQSAELPTREAFTLSPLPQAASAPARYAALDVARGVALVAMVIFHFSFDLDALGLATLGVGTSFWWRWFARLIAGSFLALSGASLVLAHGREFRPGAFMRRLAILIGAAALVTLGTWYMMRDEYIFFGILHSIAVASLVGAAFLRAPWPLTLAVAALVLLAPGYLATHDLAPAAFDAPALRWLGFSRVMSATLDFEPVFPWLAPFLFGMVIAKLGLPAFAASRAALWRPLAAFPRALAFAGRHSLAIYLIHQPVMFGTLSLVAEWRSSATSESAIPDEDRDFIGACRSVCTARSGNEAGCVTYCNCTAGELKKAGLWASVVAERLTPQERDRLAVVMQACEITPRQ